MEKSELLKLAEALRNSVSSEPYSVQGLLYQWNLRDLLEHLVRDCDAAVCLTVTDLVYCSNKYHLRMLHPLPLIQQNIYAAWASHGRLIHRGLEDLLKTSWSGVETEVEVHKHLWISNGEKLLVRISGRLDALRVMENGEKIVYEFKSSRGDSEQPKAPHVLQVRIYMALAGASRACIVYVNPDRISEYWINNPIDDIELSQLVRETINNTKHPRYDWECSYCPYSIMCPYKKINSYPRRR